MIYKIIYNLIRFFFKVRKRLKRKWMWGKKVRIEVNIYVGGKVLYIC